MTYIPNPPHEYPETPDLPYIWFDEGGGDPEDAGWVLSYATKSGDEGGEILEVSDPEDEDEAIKEAARFLQCRLDEINVAHN